MIKRTLYFGNPAYLKARDEQMVIEYPGGDTESKSIPIEDIGVVILDSPQITITHVLLNKLLENNAAVITTNERHMPSGLLYPLESNTLQSERFAVQLTASVPLKKQLWQQTVQTKIQNQAALLKSVGVDVEPMLYWARSVRSGDPDNYEGRAAAYYWKNLYMGYINDIIFTRGRNEDEPNNLLNYGYAILRAVVARSLVASGLLPTLGIHHHNRYNAFCLADDIMEPYRPFVDKVVLEIVKEGLDYTQLTKEIKAKLLVIPAMDVKIDGKSSPLMIATQRTTASLYNCFNGASRKMLYPTFS
ncbi:type II CRISPR-associated endonuclease Cas1 [Tenuifilum thalassicum]|uniref:CRISPR-associated endonuclease Cas1 n=1 Tax=Tenuifilum thalassicum TaxID=2590900 RepID=A0A7D4BD79_9BACT|nr:type II CRISPR-associated endonuclease Cas1 [Tenuifilum thalassicum]QKG79483.1 type II CRISPR-associated endonuclease Cas1 [Tenuifilum thalassicum]